MAQRANLPNPCPLPAQPKIGTMPTSHTVYLAFGSNLGDRVRYLHAGLAAVGNFAQVEATSFLYETPPAHVVDQPDYLNAVCRATTTLGPEELLARLKQTERELGRTPSIRFGPRVIDLDIILYDDIVYDSEITYDSTVVELAPLGLTIPHPRMAERDFVLQPLCDIAPELRHPQLGLTIRELENRRGQLHQEGRPVTPLRRVLPLGERLWSWGSRTAIMGILNITPDSFSADGLATPGALAVPDALAKAHSMQAAGADWLDIGGQSTRPGHALVSIQEELDRVIPVIEALVAAGLGPISVDTFRLPVAEAALAAGAAMINSVWGLGYDPGLAALATRQASPLVLLHNRSRTADPGYPPHLAAVTPLQAADDPVAVTGAEMAEQLRAGQAAGVPRWLLIADPGLGFGKAPAQSLALLRDLDKVKARAGQPWIPLVAGVSRKGFIGYGSRTATDGQPLPTDQRLEGTLAACTLAVERGADILRVHDVQAVVRAVRFTEAVLNEDIRL